jgi:uncharacterized protein (TIGR02646 family)
VIRIHKPETAPDRLTLQGKAKRKTHCLAYSRDPQSYQSGHKTFTFDATLYAHASVKAALIEAQHGKCCFCEQKIKTDGDVEHFRPKKAYKQSAGKPLQRPGYYWLAYDWHNLYLACTACNQRHKQNWFPLQNPDHRATNHRQSIAQEKTLFIDPGQDNPETLIGFRSEFAFAIDGNSRGKATIAALKLNGYDRPFLESRLTTLQRLKIFHSLVNLATTRPHDGELQELAAKAKSELSKAVQDNAEFAAVARCAVQTNFEFVIG